MNTRILGRTAPNPAVDGHQEAVVLPSGALLVDPSGVAVASGRFNTSGDAASIIVKASPGELLEISAFNNAGADRFLHLFDLVAVPINGTVPDYVSFPIPDQGAQSFFFGAGLPMLTGIVAVVSSTRTVLTIGGADMWISGRFQ